MSERRFPIYVALWRSFYCPKLYEHAAEHWRGRGFMYLLLLVTVTVLPTMLLLKFALTDFIEQEGPVLLDQWPAVTIEQGEATVEVEEPYTILDSDGDPFMVIDTTGNTHTPEEAGVPILMTRHQILMRSDEYDERTFNLRDMQDMVVDDVMLGEFWAKIQRLFLPVVTPALILFWFGFRVVQVLFYAVMGMLMLRVLELKLPYAGLVQIAILALTPALAIQLLMYVLNMHVPIEGLVVFSVAMGYLWFGIRAATASQIPAKTLR